MTDHPQKLASEKVVVNAPMSFVGSARRAWRLRRGNGLTKLLWTTLAVLVLAVWWPAIVVWYLLFGVLLIPYRLLRRGSRKRKAERLRHREMMTALAQQQKKSA